VEDAALDVAVAGRLLQQPAAAVDPVGDRQRPPEGGRGQHPPGVGVDPLVGGPPGVLDGPGQGGLGPLDPAAHEVLVAEQPPRPGQPAVVPGLLEGGDGRLDLALDGVKG